MNTRYLLLVICLLFCLFSVAQPNNPTNPVPLDGGLSLLAIGGSAYAAYRFKKKQNSQEETMEE